MHAQVHQSAARSLANLRVSAIDSLVLHSPPGKARRDLLAVWRGMEALVAAGVARQIGLSNLYDEDALRWLLARARVRPRVLQNRFHKSVDWCRGLRALCAAEGIQFQSFWTLTGNRNATRSDAVRAIAAAHGASPEALLLAWAARAEGMLPLTGTRSDAHMRADLDAVARVRLGAGETARVAAAVWGEPPSVDSDAEEEEEEDGDDEGEEALDVSDEWEEQAGA